MRICKPPVDASAGHRQRLRERFRKTGFDGFAPHEVLELILTLVIPRRDVKPTAHALLRRFGSLKGVLDAAPEDLRTVDGIGSVAPIAFKIVRESATLYLQQSAETQESFRSFRALEDFWRLRLSGLGHEVFEVGFLDSGYRLLRDGIERVEEGDVSAVNVSPRKIVGSALKRSASALILAHNHPNGALRPSADDQNLTRALRQAAEPLGLEVLDHLIIADGAVYSFRREGLL